jgi:hypothetical protein
MTYIEDRLKRKNGILPPLPTKKEKKPIAKQSPAKKKEIESLKNGNSDNELDFFQELHLSHFPKKIIFINSNT